MKNFLNKFVVSIIFVLFSFTTVIAAGPITITASNITSSSAFLNISGASPLTSLTVYVFNDPNLSPTSYSQSIDVTTDDFGNVGVNFMLPAGKSFTATTSADTSVILTSFSTPPAPVPGNATTVSVKAGTLTTSSVTVTAAGILDRNTYIFSIYNASSYPNGAPISSQTIPVQNPGDPVEATFTGLPAGQVYIVKMDPGVGAAFTSPVITNSFSTIIDPGVGSTNPGVGNTNPGVGNTNPGSSTSFKIVPDCGQVVTTTDPATGKEVSTMATPCNFEFFMQLINNIIKFLLTVLAVPLVALIIMYTGYLYITAGGNASQTEKAKGIMFKVIIGFVIALAAWLIINTIVTSFNLDPTINTFLVK